MVIVTGTRTCQLPGCGIKLTQQNFSITSESVITHWELVKRGLGILMPSYDVIYNKSQNSSINMAIKIKLASQGSSRLGYA
jgi:hypothetical protein